MKIYNGTGKDITLLDENGTAYLTIKAEDRALESTVMHTKGIKLDGRVQLLQPYVVDYSAIPDEYDIVICTRKYADAVFKDIWVEKLFVPGPPVVNSDGRTIGYEGIIRASYR